MILASAAALAAAAFAQPATTPAQLPTTPPEVLDWKSLESPLLTGHVQLTSRDRFVKAGESYFSPDGRWIVFQAVPTPAAGAAPDPFYSMYIARLERDPGGRITGLDVPMLVSPPGSANTCGWFHPTQSGRVLFGSTITPPSENQKSGFQVGTRKYVWMFPQETEVVTRFVPQAWFDMEVAAGREPTTTIAPPDAKEVVPVFSRPDYDAECSYSADGRFILYAHVREDRGERPDADIFVYDTVTKQHTPLVVADGYDGGPFFSPDGKRICYRSDRKGDDLLQVYVAELKFETGADGVPVPVGIEREHALTANEHVNWGPYWHPSGEFLVYATSEVGHTNYEVFAIEASAARLASGTAPTDLKRARVTQATGADVLPVFSPDGRWLIWTSQRGPSAEGEQRPSSQLWIAQFDRKALGF